MCILFIHTDVDPKEGDYRLVVATNRDEVFARPAKPAYKDPKTNIISGRDLEPGKVLGTWVGFGQKPYQQNGKEQKQVFSCLTNVPGWKFENATGRGCLVIDYLESDLSFPDYVAKLDQEGKIFNGFNLIGVELSKDGSVEIFHRGNRPKIDSRYSGKHTVAFGNSAITCPLTKAVRGREKFEDILEKRLGLSELEEELLGLLKDENSNLPDKILESRPLPTSPLSQIFVSIPGAAYGTRTHTIITIDKDWNLEFLEHTMEEPINIDNPKWVVTRHKSKLYSSEI